ncbi:hypothetical protein MUK42_28949 [Musa troglodytarum]|uniref:DUF4378 domain-containing protein n=1 Tax=Musa troglodytarum TaxID=320322 RepID=A0A9E7FLH1_9LILI|nr:hypothetical protein MUK42_28949 [Musa troglodytarum]
MARKLLMLKDYLELDCDSESGGKGFWQAPMPASDADADAATVRRLLDAELQGGSGRRRLPRTRSMSALTRISAVINAIRLLPFAVASFSNSALCGERRSGQEGLRSRSFSRRLSGSFWRKTGKTAAAEEVENRVRVKDIVRLRSFEEEANGDERRSFGFPSPTISSRSSWSESDSYGSDFLPSTASTDASDDIPPAGAVTTEDGNKGSPRASPRRSPMACRKSTGEGFAASHRLAPKVTESEGTGSPQCRLEEEEQQQLSPVSVMDFPSEEEDDPASRSFRHSLAKLESTPLVHFFWLLFETQLFGSRLHILAAEHRTTRVLVFRRNLLPLSRGLSGAGFNHAHTHLYPSTITLLSFVCFLYELLVLWSLVELASPASRTKLQQPKKIGRFESNADLSPVDLDRRFSSSDEQLPGHAEEGGDSRETKAWGLLGQLKASCHADLQERSTEKVLVDFFIQRLSSFDGDDLDRPLRRRQRCWTSAFRREPAEEDAVLNTARDWIEGARSGDLDDYHGEATLREMERGGRWRSFEGEGEEEGELGVDLERLVLGSLMEEVVEEFVAC